MQSYNITRRKLEDYPRIDKRFNINARVKSTVFQTVKLSVAYPKKGKASILSMR